LFALGMDAGYYLIRRHCHLAKLRLFGGIGALAQSV
jgi:hypothetical protein